MSQNGMERGGTNLTLIKTLTYLMFMMFAMTTDSVGLIIPEIIKAFSLSMTAAGTFQYATMGGIALAGFFLGSLADRLGRKPPILIGLTAFAIASFLFVAGNSLAYFSVLLAISGVAIGVFKTGALALIGDISTSTKEHTAIMNMVEAFFGVGSILGPAVLARLMTTGVSWKWLYVLAGGICVLLILMAWKVQYPKGIQTEGSTFDLGRTLPTLRNPYALAFSMGAFLYVAAEAAIYVWMPTLLQGYSGPALWLATYSISVFFVLRVVGRFAGFWVLARFEWTGVLALFSGAILLCFLGTALGGANVAVYLLPVSGLFMSVIYPTINSKGISCFPKSEHGAVAGVILFFTCVSAVLGPLAMGAVSDAMGASKYGFVLAAAFAALLFLGLLFNWILNPTRTLLGQLDQTEYEPGPTV